MPQSRASRAGLTFPVGRTCRYMRDRRGGGHRIGAKAGIYLAAVLEYVTAEVIELSGNTARDNKKQMIMPRHIMLAIRRDDELNQLLSKTIIVQSGVPELMDSDDVKAEHNANEHDKQQEQCMTDTYSQRQIDETLPSRWNIIQNNTKTNDDPMSDQLFGTMRGGSSKSKYNRNTTNDVTEQYYQTAKRDNDDLCDALAEQETEQYENSKWLNREEKEEQFPGWIHIEEIRKYQETTQLYISRDEFKSIVIQIAQQYKHDLKVQPSALLALQEGTEAFLTELFSFCNLMAINSERTIINDQDIITVMKLWKKNQKQWVEYHSNDDNDDNDDNDAISNVITTNKQLNNLRNRTYAKISWKETRKL